MSIPQITMVVLAVVMTISAAIARWFWIHAYDDESKKK